MTAPASAEPTSATQGQVDAQACVFNTPVKPYRIGTKVRGSAYSSGCASNWSFSSKLQRSGWWGWEAMASREWSGNGGGILELDRSGQYEYRVLFNFFNRVSYSGTKYSPVVTLAC